MTAMSEPEFTQSVLRPLLAWPFDNHPDMHWCGSEEYLVASAQRCNSVLNPMVETIEEGHKVDGVLRLMSHDHEGFECLVLEVSGKPYVQNPTHYANDFFKVGREMKDCYDHILSKIQQSGKSARNLKEKLGVFGIQCHAYDMEVSVFVKLFGRLFIVPLHTKKIPFKKSTLNTQLEQVEQMMLSIKVCCIYFVCVLKGRVHRVT
ncbi:hypothetical protein BDR26DRAFT_668056 [Obelidium mucronatum]|nr:hypothetical protein BDR26DRAFT_668056 [Obelidium mucronatum]